jgi:PAS domain S-box-containing protein
MPTYQDKTKDELINELQKLQLDCDSLKTSNENDITKRKKVEEALRFTRLILDNAADTMAIIDYDGRFIDFNNAFCRSVGYSQEQLLSMTVHDIDPLFPAATWSVFWEKLKQAGSLTFESLHRTKEGKIIPVEINVNYFEYKGKEYHCGFARDITERKRDEDVLRQSEMKLKTLFEVLPIGVSILDAERNVVFVNPALETILNITKDGFIRGDYKSRKYLRPDGTQLPEKEFASVRAFMEQQAVYNVETGVVMEDGNVIWTNVTAAPVAFPDWKAVIVTMDISNRKQAEEALKNLLSLTEATLESIHNGILVISLQRTVIKTNAKFAEMWRIPGDLLNSGDDKILLDYVHGQLADPDAFNAKVEELYEKPEAESFDLIYFKDGRIFERISKPMYLGSEPKGRVWSFLDITERKQAEEALRLEKENFRHSLDDSPLGVRIATLQGDTIYANRALLNFYGFDSLKELQETPLKKRYTLKSFAEALKRKRQREHGDFSATEYEISIIRKDGEIRHLQVFRKEVLWNGVRQFQVICNDITDRKHAEEALHESEERYRRLVEGSPDAIAVYSKGRFIFVNPAGAKLIGARSPRELIGKSILDVVHPDSRSQVIERLRHVAEGKEAPLFEEKFLKFDGSVINVEVVGIPFSYQGQAATQVVVRDITKRKQAEEEIRKSTKLLEDLHKHLNEILENERALISREIHDQVGQSLTALKLDLNRIQKYLNNNPEAVKKLRDMIELISNTIKDVQRISSDLRPGILDDLGLAAAIEWYCDEFEKRTGIKCSLRLDDSIFGDSQMNLVFFRVLQEALTNVIRHANASSVTIKLHHTQKGTTLTIHDNGIGIKKEKIESAKSLGLIGMRERVRQFGGKVNISSGKEQGAKLTIYIPS